MTHHDQLRYVYERVEVRMDHYPNGGEPVENLYGTTSGNGFNESGELGREAGTEKTFATFPLGNGPALTEGLLPGLKRVLAENAAARRAHAQDGDIGD